MRVRNKLFWLFSDTYIELILSEIQRIRKKGEASYHKSLQRVMVARSNELW